MTRRAYGIDSSPSGHVGWCNCGWRTPIEFDWSTASCDLIHHRVATHHEARLRVTSVLVGREVA